MKELSSGPLPGSRAAYEPWARYGRVPFIVDLPSLPGHLITVSSSAFSESGFLLAARLAESVSADELQVIGRLIDRLPAASTASSHANAEERRRVEKVIRLLDEWTADESGYDEETWPELKAALEHDRLSSRELFND
jgi:hypothetical protein